MSQAARGAWLLVLAAVLGLAGCMGGGDDAGSARDGGSIGIGVSALPETLDPALATEPAELQLLWLVHTPLVTYRRAGGREGTQLVPGLAEELPEVSEDGLTYRLSLRPGLTYSSGAAVRAGDFERAIDRLRALDSPLAPLYEGIVSIDADARTGAIKVTLARPDPSFPYLLALPASAPAPRGTPQKDLSRRPPAGVGPYRLVRSETRVVLLRTRGFVLSGVSAGHIDRITVSRPRPPVRQVQAVITGSLDVMQEPAPVDLLPEIRTKYRSRYRENTTASTVALVPDASAPPLNDPMVRRAVGVSVDPETLTRLYQGLLEPSCNVLPPAIQGYHRLDPCPIGDLDEPPDLPAAKDQIDKAAANGASVSVIAAAGVPAAAERYVVRNLRKIGLAASTRRGGARVRVQRFAPLVAHPAAFLEPITGTVLDTELSDAVGEATLPQAGDEADDAWATADRLVVEQGYAAPLGSERRPSFLSERLDIENCFRFQPLFGLDLSSLCIR
ncbi:MAG TPA: ABC transporter substrate-binding protein [Thermoleophilaceae bacterium]|nr:ABC transporter substrate-binding protein [Thermoleophilaceae bacterium]